VTAKVRAAVTFVVLAAAIAGCAASQSYRGGSLPDILSDVRAHPESRLKAEVGCERSIARPQSDFPYRSFFAGVFDVPEAEGARAFCAALVEAVIADDLTERDVAVFRRPQELRGKAPLGTFLRALMVAHERLYAQQAQRPPQAQSCGCGQ
jgi:hypothetical protein